MVNSLAATTPTGSRSDERCNSRQMFTAARAFCESCCNKPVGLEARPWALVVKHAIEWLNPSGRVSRKAGRQRDDVVRGEAPSGAGEPIDKLLS